MVFSQNVIDLSARQTCEAPGIHESFELPRTGSEERVPSNALQEVIGLAFVFDPPTCRGCGWRVAHEPSDGSRRAAPWPG